MNKLTAEVFDDLCDSVRASISSLKSCGQNEVRNEARILRGVLAELEGCQLRRRNGGLSQRKQTLVDEAYSLLARREGRVEIKGVLYWQDTRSRR